MSRSLSLALRPCLNASVKPRCRDAYLRFYTANTQAKNQRKVAEPDDQLDSLWSSVSYRKRLRQLTALHPEGQNAPTDSLYPRIGKEKRLSPAQFRRQAEKLNLAPGDWARKVEFKLQGKIQRVRAMSRKLLFLDVVENEHRVQVMVSLENLQKKGTYSSTEVDDLRKRISVGDYYAFSGVAHRTPNGELTLSIQELPQLLAPSLHILPTTITDKETLARLPQLDLLLHPKRRDLLRLRHVIEQTIAGYLDNAGFIKVTTPILAADTGGAAAQPFETSTNEIPNVPLRLRIAPEIGLKKLTAAGLGAVYEIGPCFRNEGLDSTHNPEFTTCEFYKPFTSLDTLMSMTEELLVQMARACQEAVETRLTSLEKQDLTSEYFLSAPSTFARLPFLPTLLERIREVLPGSRLPRRLDESAVQELLELFAQLQQKAPELEIKTPVNPTASRLLDSLSSYFIEPLCQKPTFITGHPAIMSPLAKSYYDPRTDQVLSARAELFVGGVEFANLYEEENDPFMQARKFLQQARGTAALTNEFGIDLSHEEVKARLSPSQQYYVRVLELGLPPTGGWGCGIERLVMLFGGAKRISEVLPFGSLRSVIAMGTGVDAKGRLVVDKA
ncbi:lysine-tRNA ligase, variant [Verruconis gallopava]|uniref:Lysine-tRNA ligase n=1 Tax=Verruconis gallopava TaxID=253628 RepID=A0A0D2A621_9PEZI|nr:lysine-tRNA ligase [Verruconis gallopava]XP_016212058.1 lysine-tRNA ligase, variant [Verruconis gallopava]KIW02188.1 lysine-tRNA ligase [Verruconis gallopava]KIW02189.1 lysine-tRNA ligase, variant [Verruconis gallopava]